MQIVIIVVDALISIHALLAESDPGKSNKLAGRNCNFYPRSPCGERQRANRLAHAPPQISIHALLAESDLIRYRISAK